MADDFDIFAGQPTPAETLAELYDLEHDQIEDDAFFYREIASRTRGVVLDAGCGSGRLLRALLGKGRGRVLGIDGSAALLQRAETRIARDPELRLAAAAGRLRLALGDVRAPRLAGHFSLITVVGVLPHLDGPQHVASMLVAMRRRLTRAGRLVLDDLGPVQMPQRDLPLSLDWTRISAGRTVRRLSRLVREDVDGGVRVSYSTLTETAEPDGTIARLPAGYRLWYPTPDTLERLVAAAGLAVELGYGSHDLEPLGPESERRIFIVRRSGSS